MPKIHKKNKFIKGPKKPLFGRSYGNFSKALFSIEKLPPPPRFSLDEEPNNFKTYEIECENSFYLILSLLQGDFDFKTLKKIKKFKNKTETEIVNWLCYILVKAFCYYDFFSNVLIARDCKLFENQKAKVGEDIPAGLDFNSGTTMQMNVTLLLAKKGGSKSLTHTINSFETFQIMAGLYWYQYLTVKKTLYYKGAFGKSIGIPISTFNSMFQRNIFEMFKQISVRRSEFSFFTRNAIHNALLLSKEIYEFRSKCENFPVKQNFSTIKTSEFALVASRDASMIKKYGEKTLEKHFENQISLMMQSFGFYVSGAKIGKRIVDLICVSQDSTNRFTVLIDAKTSSGPYAFPTADQRAIVEYVKYLKRKMTVFPAVKLVIIVGPPPSKSISAKIRSLQSQTDTPIRYLEASTLAKIREAHLNPTIFNDVIEKMILSEPVTSSKVLDETVLSTENKKRSFEVFLNSLLD